MKIEQRKEVEKVNYKAYIIFTTGVIGQIVVFVIGNYAGAIYSTAPLEALVISAIITVMGFVGWGIIRFFLQRLLYAGENGHKEGLDKLQKEASKSVCCQKNSSLLCPLNVGLSEYGLTLKISDATSKEDRLYEKENIYEIEKNGKQGSPWKNIWIFSENLSSEIDSSNNKAEPVLVTNITANRTKYTIFYLGIENQKSEIEIRKEALLKSLSPRDKKLLTFIPIDVKSGYLGKNTLPLLCGSILFSQNQNGDGTPIFAEGYLSIRKNNDDIPIYYSMPRCMLREYVQYYNIIKKNKQNGGIVS